MSNSSSSSKKTTSLETISDELDLLDLADNLYYDISHDNHKGAIAILRKEPLLANHVYTDENYSDLRQTGLEMAIPLSIACYYGNYEVVKELFKKQYYIDVNFKSYGNMIPLQLVDPNIMNKGEMGYSIVKKLIQNGADVNNMDIEGNTLFRFICENYNEDMINYLLKIPDLDMNKRLDGGDGALHTIVLKYCERGYIENELSVMEKVLKKEGLDINSKGEGGETVLHILASIDRKQDLNYSDDKLKNVVLLLLDNGVDPNIKNNRGKLALENDIIQETYNQYVLSKLLRSKQRMSFAKMMIDSKHMNTPNDVVIKILKSLKVPPLTKETMDKTNKILVKTLQEELSKEIEQSLRKKFKGQKLDDMIETYRKLIENPNTPSKQRKQYRKMKRSRKKKIYGSSTPLTPSDKDTSELELKRAIEMSIQEAKSGSKRKKIKSKKKLKK